MNEYRIYRVHDIHGDLHDAKVYLLQEEEGLCLVSLVEDYTPSVIPFKSISRGSQFVVLGSLLEEL